MKLNIKYNGRNIPLQCETDETLYSAIKRSDINISFPCAGKGVCGKCRVKVTKGNVTPLDPSETKHLKENEIKDDIRLACFLKPVEDTDIYIEDPKKHQILSTHSETLDFKPIVKMVHVKLEPPSLHDQNDDFNRLKSAIELKTNQQNISCPINLIRKLPVGLRENNFEVTAIMFENEILNIVFGNEDIKAFGLAVDIGTTTVVMYLIDLISGKIIDFVSSLNNQKLYGDDVISRINYTIENNDGTESLNHSIINQLNSMSVSLCENNNIVKDNIYSISLCANTTITHFLLGLPTVEISKSPFTPVFNDLMVISSSIMGLNLNDNAVAIIAPGKSAYVGGDILVGASVCDMDKSEDLCLLIDIGTNGEIVLGNSHKLYCCATAAGPAFEGCHIECGLGGVTGAINKFTFIDGIPVYETIGNEKPTGICGSGILDTINALLKEEIIEETGFMEDEKYDITDSVYISQKDVREIQLAKSAICAGIKTLAKEANVTLDQIKKVYLAGGFGNYMDIESALSIGLIPKELRGKIINVGNSAGSGAIAMTTNNDFLQDLNNIKDNMEYIELSSNPYFLDLYINEMIFDIS